MFIAANTRVDITFMCKRNGIRGKRMRVVGIRQLHLTHEPSPIHVMTNEYPNQSIQCSIAAYTYLFKNLLNR